MKVIACRVLIGEDGRSEVCTDSCCFVLIWTTIITSLATFVDDKH